MKEVKWATMIPLIGGSALGCKEATGKLPEFHLSYEPFESNEKHLIEYWPNVERVNLSENKAPKVSLDFINSVCPCAGLSQLNTSKNKEAKDNQNAWMMRSSKLILENMKPRVLWGENAPGLFTNSGKHVRDQLNEIAQQNGYSFSIYKTSTFKHGIPQKRLRTFYFFWDSPTAPILNWYEKPYTPFVDYIQKIPEGASQQDSLNLYDIEEKYPSYTFLLNKYQLTHSKFIEEFGNGPAHSVHQFIVRNDLIDECLDWLEVNRPDHKEIKKFNHIKNKLSMGKSFLDHSPAFYYDCTNAIVGRTLMMLMHPIEFRGLSHREIIHMMGMPHDFELKSKHLNHLAQNVPTSTAKDMTTEVLKYLNGELKDSGFESFKQDNIKKINLTWS